MDRLYFFWGENDDNHRVLTIEQGSRYSEGSSHISQCETPKISINSLDKHKRERGHRLPLNNMENNIFYHCNNGI